MPSRNENILRATIDGIEYTAPAQSRIEELLLELKEAIEGSGGSPADAYTKSETDALLDGKADLTDGKVPTSQLPSYVDDVVEYSSVSAFPVTGEAGKIYLALDMNRTYRWAGSEYIPVPDYNIWKGTAAQYSQLQTDDYDLYFVVEVSS